MKKQANLGNYMYSLQATNFDFSSQINLKNIF